MIVRAAILLLTSLLAVVPSPVSPLVMRHNAEELKLSRFIFKVRLMIIIKKIAHLIKILLGKLP